MKKKEKKGLKVVHICYSTSGGAGIAANNLHKGLKALGVNSIIFAAEDLKNTNSNKFTGFNTTLNKLNRLEFNTYKGMQKIISINKTFPKVLGIPLKGVLAEYDFWNNKNVQEADIINLHWILEAIDVSFFEKAKSKPLVWTLHDMLPFTGGCHYSWDCEKYAEQCGKCPQIKSNIERDLSRFIYNKKNQAYNQCNITTVGTSKWITNKAKKSSLLKKTVLQIPYGIDTNIFKPQNKEASRKKYNIPSKNIWIMFCANYNAPTKGGIYLQKALESLTDSEKNKLGLLILGDEQKGMFDIAGIKTIRLGKFTDPTEISERYNLADIFIFPSVQESFGLVAIEAMACGTPVIGANVGIIPEVIKDKINGLIFETKDSDQLKEKILWALKNKDKLKQMGKKASTLVRKKYTLKNQAKGYLKVYKKLNNLS